jgi:hypothetical protein
MTLDEILREKSEQSLEVPNAFQSAITRQERKMLLWLEIALSQLERDSLGNILTTSNNLALTTQILEGLKDVFFDASYSRALRSFLQGFDIQASLTNELFALNFDLSSPPNLAAQVLQASKRNAITLFSESVINTTYFEPLRNQLYSSISSNASFTDTLKVVQEITVGNDQADALLSRYAKTYTRTSYGQADRVYMDTVAKEVGVEWYRYSGGTVQETREFCDKRVGKFYHRKEVEQWGNETTQWQGRMKGTNSATIFQNLGGWNCMHRLIPYSVRAVPKEVVLRNVRNGNYTPSASVKEWLGV